MKYAAVLFDFNGVILWDRQWHEIAWDDLSELVMGRKLTREEHEQYVHGRTPGESLEFIVGHKPTEAEQDELLTRKELLYQKICLQSKDFHLSPGAEKLFNELKEHGIKRTIATSSPLVNIDFYYQHLGLAKWFPRDDIVYDDRTFPGKPAPDIYLRAADKLGVDIRQCVVVEDAKSGMIAATKAGAGKIIAVLHKDNHSAADGLDIAKFVENLGQISIDDVA
ncbi:MAG TPA: HAD family phosphatase [Candidatus Pristimantibacillus sp.]|nr:HAD family phosphatase [Candidatus Pristimantibacillus sp.]